MFPLRFTILALASYSCVFRSFSSALRMSENLIALDFEVFGLVQGVFFRKNTCQQAEKLGLRGWCMNTPQGTVKGQAEGPEDQMKSMKFWLQNTGSPMSKIDKAVFSNEHQITEYSFKDFGVKKHK